MDGIKAISPGNATQNASSTADSEKAFFHTIKHGNRIQICRAILHEFFADSSIQGFKYFCERKRHWSEKIFWMIMFGIATGFSGHMIYDLYDKWDSTPVIVTFNEKATPVWKVPFPAVTICPEVKISSKMLNLTRTLHMIRDIESNQTMAANITEEMKNQLAALIHICNYDMIPDLNPTEDFANPRLIQILNNISIKLDDSMDDCIWREKVKNCSDLFRPILTEDGVCFTFNSLNSRDIYSEKVAPELLSVNNNPSAPHWNLEEGYKNKVNGISTLNTYPFRILGTGTLNGLRLELFLNRDDLDYMCQGPIQGFKVVLSAPAEIPQPSINYFRVPLDQEVLVSVKAKMLETSPKLHGYEPNRKSCYMQKENPLKFFKVYTQRHCELECTSNSTKGSCGCVPFLYPRDRNTSICEARKFKCVDKIEEEMVEKIFLGNLDESLDANDHTCNCLPECTSINYEIELSAAQYDVAKFYRAVPGKPYSSVDFDKTAFASLNIYFKEKQFFTSRRDELYGRTKFLAECGGILGLFIGVTALSFAEILYYFTLRLVWTLRMYRYGKSKDFSNSSVAVEVQK